MKKIIAIIILCMLVMIQIPLVKPATFGHTSGANPSDSIEDIQRASYAAIGADGGWCTYIKAHVQVSNGLSTFDTKCALYKFSSVGDAGDLIDETEELTLSAGTSWQQFNFSSPVWVDASTNYYLAILADTDGTGQSIGISKSASIYSSIYTNRDYDLGFLDPWTGERGTRSTVYAIYGYYTIEPTQTGENPVNNSVNVSFDEDDDGERGIMLNITVDDADDDNLDVYWYSNSSGSWDCFGTNLSVSTSGGSVNLMQFNSNFSSYNQTCYWSVNVTDGVGWTNSTYDFTTLLGRIRFGFMGEQPYWLEVDSSYLHSACGDLGTLRNALDGTGSWTHFPFHDHWFIIDLGGNYTVSKVRSRSNSVADPINVSIFVSTTPDGWGDAVASDISTFQDTSGWVEESTTEKLGRYVYVVVYETEAGSGSPNIIWGRDIFPFSIFDVYGAIDEGEPFDPNWVEEPLNNSLIHLSSEIIENGTRTAITIDYSQFVDEDGVPPMQESGGGLYFDGNLIGMDSGLITVADGLNDTQGFIIRMNDSGLYAIPMFFESEDVRYGDSYLITSDSASNLKVTSINDTHFLVVYANGDNDYNEYVVCSLNEDESITVGTIYQMGDNSDETIHDLDNISSDALVIIYNGMDDNLTIRHIQIDNLTVKFYENWSAFRDYDEYVITALNDTHFVIGFENTSNNNNGTLNFGTIHGGLSVDSTEYYIADEDYLKTGSINIARKNDTDFSIFYRNSTNPPLPYQYSSFLQMGRFNGTGIELGDVNHISDWQTDDLDNFEYVWLNDNRFVGMYHTYAHDDALACAGFYNSFDDISISPGFEIDANTTNARNYVNTFFYPYCINSSHFCITYINVFSPGYGALDPVVNSTIGYLADSLYVSFQSNLSGSWDYYGLGIMGICQNQTIYMYNKDFNTTGDFYWRVNATRNSTGVTHEEWYKFTIYVLGNIIESAVSNTSFLALGALGIPFFMIGYRRRIKNKSSKR